MSKPPPSLHFYTPLGLENARLRVGGVTSCFGSDRSIFQHTKYYKNNSCSRILSHDYQLISLLNRQETSSIPARLLNKPSVEINSIKFPSNLEAKSPRSRHRICASSYLNHSAIRLTLLSGNRQSAPANSQLAKPLSVVALSAAGEPLANLPISFDILRGTGKHVTHGCLARCQCVDCVD